MLALCVILKKYIIRLYVSVLTFESFDYIIWYTPTI